MTAMSELVDLLRELQVANDDSPALFDALGEAADRIEALEAHIEALSNATKCACDYDAPGEVCEYHSKIIADRLSDAIEEITRLKRSAGEAP